MDKVTVSVVIPAYNEETAIGEVLDGIKRVMDREKIPYEIVVVDDGSRDRTAEIVREKGVRLISHEHNRGVGASHKTGIKAALGEVIVHLDADGTYPVEMIPQLLRELDNADMVIGARIGQNVARSFSRLIPKFFIRKLAGYLVKRPIPDLNSGFQVFRKELAQRYFYLLPDTHSWVATITLSYLSNHHRVKFVPIDYYARKGKSSFHPIYDTYNYISLVVRTIMYFNPLRIFLPLSFFIFLSGGVKTVYDYSVYHNIGGFDVTIMLTAVIVTCIGLLADLIVVLHRK